MSLPECTFHSNPGHLNVLEKVPPPLFVLHLSKSNKNIQKWQIRIFFSTVLKEKYTFCKSLTFWARLAALVRISGVNSVSYSILRKNCAFVRPHFCFCMFWTHKFHKHAQKRTIAQLERNFAQLERNFKKWYDTIPRTLSVRTQIWKRCATGLDGPESRFCKKDIIYLVGVGEITPPNGNFLKPRLLFEYPSRIWWNVNKSKRIVLFSSCFGRLGSLFHGLWKKTHIAW